MLAEERRRRLLAAMAEAGIAELVLYGNAWQGDYLRYAADFGILEGHGIAVMQADGTTELFLDSATEAERAEAETPGVKIRFATRHRPRRRRAARSRRQSSPRGGAAPLPAELARGQEPQLRARRRHGAARQAADAQAARRDRGAAARGAAGGRRLCGVPPGGGAGPPAIRAGRRHRGLSAPARLPGQFHDHRLRRQGRARHDAAVGAPHRASAIW